jgi:hypothetical protein
MNIRALVEKAMRGLVRFKSREARELFFIRLAFLESLEQPKETKTARKRRASHYFRQHGDHIDA